MLKDGVQDAGSKGEVELTSDRPVEVIGAKKFKVLATREIGCKLGVWPDGMEG